MELQKNNKLEYKGKLEAYQLYRGNTYTEYEKDNYNGYQNHLYKRALYGLSAFTQDEIATMCSKKKQRVVNVYKKAQLALNKLKQQATINYSNFIFKTLFLNSPITEFLLADAEIDEKFVNTLNFKDLGIDKNQIITIFMSEGILPKNFLSLEGPQNQLPRLKNDKA